VKRIVEPNDCRGAFPHLVANNFIVSVYHPAIGTDGHRHEFGKILPHGPVWTPVKRVKLNVGSP
jgi:hypothetical protein